MARRGWQERASAVVSNLLLQDRRVAVFVCAGNTVVVRSAGRSRANLLMRRADCEDVVLVGVYDCACVPFDVLMGDVADAVRRRRLLLQYGSRRVCLRRRTRGDHERA